MGKLADIDHFVVLMLENRSFDNLLGYLHPASASFDGLTGRESVPDGHGGSLLVHPSGDQPRAAWLPTPDPGEKFTDINTQLFGRPDVGYGAPPPPMNGFAINYATHGGNPADIMHCFRPEEVPALSALARSYAVCDRWFAAAPCQTWPNRFFVHTATANGYENNAPAHFPYLMTTIFNALDDKVPHGWQIYFHDFPQSLTLTALWEHLDHFQPIDNFFADAKAGTLPSYSFLEPRYFADKDWPNDMHPPHNVTYGDQLVASVYQALRTSPCWQRTLLVITFDEHGGCYDHVPPPAAPVPSPPAAGQPCAFDRFGVRVPAVVVSPWIAPGTVFRSDVEQPFDHTAIIRTLRERFGIARPLSGRDLHAPHLEPVLNLAAPSDAGREDVKAQASPVSDDEQALEQARMAPLSDFQQALHDAMGHLAPLMHGVEASDHASMLQQGLRVAENQARTVGEAVRNLGNLVRRLL